MRGHSRVAPTNQLLIAAAIAGVSGDLLLRGGMWRLGFALWIAGLIASVFVIGGTCCTERVLLLTGLAMAAFGLVWRDAPMLYTIDLLSVLCMGALTIWHGTGRSVTDLSIIDTVRAGVIAVLNTLVGASTVLETRAGDPSVAVPVRRNVRGLLLGIALAIIPMFVVTALLVNSDVVFGQTMDHVLTTITADGLTHVPLAALLAWLATGILRASLGNPIGSFIPDPAPPGVPFISVGVGLYALLALLLSFVAIQGRVLFGGAEFIQRTAGLSVANYARDGFFQLIVASAVVTMTLVIAEWLLTDDDEAARRHYRMLSGALLALVAVLLVSSAVRIWLYVQEFGLSVDRAFASAAIVWVSGALVAFAVTTLRGHGSRFVPAAIYVTVAWVAMMNLSNPEAIVVSVNVARAEAGQSFDTKYHARLSADALPTMLANADRLAPADCAALHEELRSWWATRLAHTEDGGQDWRSRDLPLQRARAWFDAAPATCGATPPRT